MRTITFLATVLVTLHSAFGADSLTVELARGIAFLEKRLASDPDDSPAANQLAERLLRRAAWTGSLDDLRRADSVVAQSLRSVPAEQNHAALALAARVAMTMHRFSEAKKHAEKLLELQPKKAQPHQLLGDACLELGDIERAESAFAEVLKITGDSIATEARLARVALLRGKLEEAREHYEGAVNLARDPAEAGIDTLAWCLLRSGELAFRTGNFAEAEKQYGEALKLAPEHWSSLEHLAELRAAQGKDAEAVDLFTRAIKSADRAELWQALGDCHAFFKRSTEAKAAHERALAGYMASIERGEILYIHHLAGFFSDSQENSVEAVKWARKDLEMRQTGAAHDALAWALYKQGDLSGAKEASRAALKTGTADSHLLYHAAMIHISAGEIEEGQRLLRKCAEVNPQFNSFHVHR